MLIAITSRLEELNRFVDQAGGKDVPEQIQSYLSRFGAVLICGFIERSVELVLMERLTLRAHPRILSFIRAHFKRGTNYDCESIGQLLVRFDTTWYEHFRIFVASNDDVREGISSAYAVRNSVAHGGGGSMGLNRLKELLQISERLVSGLEAATYKKC